MLDDLKLIHEKDAQDALGIAAKQWQQLENTLTVVQPVEFQDINNIVFSGMGGSALYGLMFASWPGVDIPYEVSRNYDIPRYVGGNTLFIASSYSGNTEETLSALAKAEENGAQIAVIAGGGKLLDIAQAKKYPYVILPKVSQPRFAALSGLNALVLLLSFLVGNEKTTELASGASFLKQASASWLVDVPTVDNLAKKLAYDVVGSSPVIYAGPLLFPAAYKWKISFNENAKNIAWCNQYPEFNHNEFLGWTSHPVDKPYKVIDLKSSFDHPQVKKRFEVTDRLLSGRRPAAIAVEAQGVTVFEQLVWTVTLGDFVSLYTAILNGQNPTPVDIIEKFKQEISK